MRPQARAQAGYYPLKPGAALKALEYLKCEVPERVGVLDPCVGEGHALKIILDGLKIPYQNVNAVELASNRAETARETLPGANVIGPSDYLGGVNQVERAFRFVYCNPPYDDEMGGGYRVEASFLDKVTKALQIGGILLIVVPENTWFRNQDFRSCIARNYIDVLCVYPNQEDRPYKEVLLFGVRKENKNTDPVWMTPTLMEKENSDPYVITPQKVLCTTLKKVKMTDDELKESVLASPICSEIRLPDPPDRGRPPLALNEGHNGMLVASGQAPPVVARRDKQGRLLEIPHMIRGNATKATYIVSDEDEEKDNGEVVNKKVIGEIVVLTVHVLTFDGELRKLEYGQAPEAEPEDQLLDPVELPPKAMNTDDPDDDRPPGMTILPPHGTTL